MEDSIQCSQCGSRNSVEIRFAASVATSRYMQSDYPAPTTTTVITNDDIRIWQIGLCSACLPKGYRNFLRNHINKVALPLGVLAFMFIVSLLVIHFNLSTGNIVITILVTLAIAAGVIGIPIYIIMLIKDFIQIKKLDRFGVVPPKQVDKAFIGEGQRINTALSPGKNKPQGKVWGEFLLPEHKPLDLVNSKRFNQKKDYAPKPGDFGGPERDIEAVGKTLANVENKLPPQWKIVWEQRNKQQQPVSENNAQALPIPESPQPVQKIESAKEIPKPAGKVCPNCGYSPRFGELYCRKCGSKLVIR